jgi:hypothetical protein
MLKRFGDVYTRDEYINCLNTGELIRPPFIFSSKFQQEHFTELFKIHPSIKFRVQMHQFSLDPIEQQVFWPWSCGVFFKINDVPIYSNIMSSAGKVISFPDLSIDTKRNHLKEVMTPIISNMAATITIWHQRKDSLLQSLFEEIGSPYFHAEITPNLKNQETLRADYYFARSKYELDTLLSEEVKMIIDLSSKILSPAKSGITAPELSACVVPIHIANELLTHQRANLKHL